MKLAIFDIDGTLTDTTKDHLTRLGAVHVVQDYCDSEGFIQLLEEAKIPNA